MTEAAAQADKAVAAAGAVAAATVAAAGGDATDQAIQPHHIAVGRQFLTSKELRLAVETSLMVNGRGLVCKKVIPRASMMMMLLIIHAHLFARCSYLLPAVKVSTSDLETNYLIIDLGSFLQSVELASTIVVVSCRY